MRACHDAALTGSAACSRDGSRCDRGPVDRRWISRPTAGVDGVGLERARRPRGQRVDHRVADDRRRVDDALHGSERAHDGGMRVSRSTGRRMPVRCRRRRPVRCAASALDDALGEGAAALRLEAGGGVVGDRRPPARCAARSRCRRSAAKRLAAVACSDGSGSSAVITAAAVLAQRLATWRASVLSPPNWPTTTRQLAAATCRRRRAARARGSWRRPGPVPVRAPLISSARTVAGPHTPSASTPQLRWKSSSARAVAGPKIPSTRPQSKPSRPSGDCSPPTSSPRRFGATRRSGRSPSFHVASTRASHVCSSQRPWSCRPRWRWKARDGGLGRRRRTDPPRRRPGGTRRHRGGAADRGWRRRADRGSAGRNEEFVELLEQLALALGADEALAAPRHRRRPAGSGCSSR